MSIKNDNPQKEKKPKAKPKHKHTTLIIPPDKLRIIDNHAVMMGLNRSQYLIARGIKRVYVRSREVPPVEIIALTQVLRELKRQGNNLNQIARRLNAGIKINEKDLSIHLEATKILTHLLKQWQD